MAGLTLHSRRAAHSSTEKRPDRRSPRPLRTRGSRILRRFARSADCATMPPHKPFDCETAYTQEKKRRDNGARGAAFARGLLLSACGPLRCLDICEQRIGPGQSACTDGLLRVSEHLQGRSGILPLDWPLGPAHAAIAANCTLFDRLLGESEQLCRYFEAQRLGGLEIDHQLVDCI